MTKRSALAILTIATGVSALILCVASLRVQAAENAYLKIEGLDGSSKDPAHLHWIEVTRVAAGDLNGEAMADREAVAEATAHTGSGGGAGKATRNDVASTPSTGMSSKAGTAPRDAATGQASGKRQHEPFVIMKLVDAASPKLAQACASGKHFTSVEVDLGGQHYELWDVVIAADQKSSGGEKPTETITLTYQKIGRK